jgi:menaquinone-dependent protoporphyrinogen oxidase
MSILIAYATIEGQTEKIARFVEARIKENGMPVTLYATSKDPDEINVEDYDKVILAASVHERRHPVDFEVFLTANRDQLDRRQTLLLSVSLSAAFPEGLEEAQDYVDEMKMRTELDPDVEMLIAGAVRTKRYDYYATQVLRHVVLRGRNFDPAVQEHEFTDWDSLAVGVDAFVA